MKTLCLLRLTSFGQDDATVEAVLEMPQPTKDSAQPQDPLTSRSAKDGITPADEFRPSTHLGTSTSEEHESETPSQVFGNPSDQLHQVGIPIYEKNQREEEEEELGDYEDIEEVARHRQLAGKKEEEEEEDEFKSSYVVAKEETPAGEQSQASKADIVTASVSSPRCDRNEDISSEGDPLRTMRRKRLLYYLYTRKS